MELFGKIHSTENMLRGKMGKIECWALSHSLGKAQRRFSEDQMLGILLQCVTCLAPPPSSQFNMTQSNAIDRKICRGQRRVGSRWTTCLLPPRKRRCEFFCETSYFVRFLVGHKIDAKI